MNERSKWESDEPSDKESRVQQTYSNYSPELNGKIRENPWAAISPRPNRPVNCFARFASDVRPLVQNIWTGKVRSRPKSARTLIPVCSPSHWAQLSARSSQADHGREALESTPIRSPELPQSAGNLVRSGRTAGETRVQFAETATVQQTRFDARPSFEPSSTACPPADRQSSSGAGQFQRDTIRTAPRWPQTARNPAAGGGGGFEGPLRAAATVPTGAAAAPLLRPFFRAGR